ncbi:conserved exported hypothetical protein [Candidatus Terasakiella magnetica]|nr:conserved exported hypothetical protein [Candidatus Terasakiella magnetica]
MGRVFTGAVLGFLAAMALYQPEVMAAASTDTNPTAATPQAAVIEGYRTAHFGMKESDVRKAIKKDLDPDKITVVPNDLERTNVLVVKDQKLLADTPPATVTYILGATSSKLIQVNVVWGEDGGADVKKVVVAANALVAYFADKGAYAKDSVAINQQLPDGSTLAFRATDAAGHMVVLQLLPVVDKADVKEDKKGAKFEVKKAILKLSYIENPTKPDVFRIDKGQF